MLASLCSDYPQKLPKAINDQEDIWSQLRGTKSSLTFFQSAFLEGRGNSILQIP
jgi:hypothetical protein